MVFRPPPGPPAIHPLVHVCYLQEPIRSCALSNCYLMRCRRPGRPVPRSPPVRQFWDIVSLRRYIRELVVSYSCWVYLRDPGPAMDVHSRPTCLQSEVRWGRVKVPLNTDHYQPIALGGFGSASSAPGFLPRCPGNAQKRLWVMLRPWWSWSLRQDHHARYSAG